MISIEAGTSVERHLLYWLIGLFALVVILIVSLFGSAILEHSLTAASWAMVGLGLCVTPYVVARIIEMFGLVEVKRR